MHTIYIYCLHQLRAGRGCMNIYLNTPPLSLFLSLSLSLLHVHTHTHCLSHTYAHNIYILPASALCGQGVHQMDVHSRTLSLSLAVFVSLTRTHSLTHTQTDTHTQYIYTYLQPTSALCGQAVPGYIRKHTLFPSLSLFLSLPLLHVHTYTHTLSHTHT